MEKSTSAPFIVLNVVQYVYPYDPYGTVSLSPIHKTTPPIYRTVPTHANVKPIAFLYFKLSEADSYYRYLISYRYFIEIASAYL